MFPKRLALPVLAVACVTAAAAGGYFAARQNAVPTPAAAQSQPADFAAPASTPAKPVQETEAVVGDTTRPAPAVAAAPPATPSSSTRSKTTRRADAAPASRSTAAASTPARRERTTATRQDPPALSSSWPSNSGSTSASQ